MNRGGKSIAIGMDRNIEVIVTNQGFRGLSNLRARILIKVMMVTEKNSNGEPIRPVITWYADSFQLFRSKKYISVMHPQTPSTSSLSENEIARMEFSTTNLNNSHRFLPIHNKSLPNSPQGLEIILFIVFVMTQL